MRDWKERVDSVSRELERYLESQPHAADSLEGISTWWISKQCIHYELKVVRAALENLVSAGIVSRTSSSGNKGPVYRLNEKSQ